MQHNSARIKAGGGGTDVPLQLAGDPLRLVALFFKPPATETTLRLRI